MNAMLRSIATLALGLALLLPTPALAEEDLSAEGTFRRAHEDVVALIDGHATDERVEARVDALIDYHFMAVAALGGREHYAKRCGERCDEYEALLAQLIRRNYLKRLRAKDRGQVEYLGEIEGKNAHKVDTRVRFVDATGTQRKVKLSYIMHHAHGPWQVREIFTDGVSLTDNNRHQMKTLYKEGGIDLIIERLQAKLAKTPAKG